ncbi:hypothetical protein A2U01_0072575, partial [Trifolium medium]|nr:hypothetical protein [Trifolium medium]
MFQQSLLVWIARGMEIIEPCDGEGSRHSCAVFLVFGSRGVDGHLGLISLPVSLFYILSGIALLNQNFDGVLQMDAIFSYVPVASV